MKNACLILTLWLLTLGLYACGDDCGSGGGPNDDQPANTPFTVQFFIRDRITGLPLVGEGLRYHPDSILTPSTFADTVLLIPWRRGITESGEYFFGPVAYGCILSAGSTIRGDGFFIFFGANETDTLRIICRDVNPCSTDGGTYEFYQNSELLLVTDEPNSTVIISK